MPRGKARRSIWVALAVLAVGQGTPGGAHAQGTLCSIFPVLCAPAPAPDPELAMPPGQPTEGPGGSDYLHGDATISLQATARLSFHVYEPADPPAVSPTTFAFLPGAGTTTPDAYHDYFVHLARKGYRVVFANYYASFFDLGRLVPNAVDTLREASRVLGLGDAPVALGGHSLGALLALCVASRADLEGIPVDMLILVDPAGVQWVDLPLGPGDLDYIHPSVKLLALQAETSVGHPNSFFHGALANTVSIPDHSKNGWLIQHDAHGSPALESTHEGIRSDGAHPLDAIDYQYWKPTEEALSEILAVLDDDNPSYSPFCRKAAPACAEARDAGTWSDGTPVAPMQNTEDLATR